MTAYASTSMPRTWLLPSVSCLHCWTQPRTRWQHTTRLQGSQTSSSTCWWFGCKRHYANWLRFDQANCMAKV